MKSLAKNAAFNVVYKLLNMLFPLVTSIYVSRILQADGVGKVSFAQTIASYFIVFATMGLPYYGLRTVSKIRDDNQKLNTLFTELFLFGIVTTLLSTATYGVMIWCIPSMHNELPLYVATGFVICLNAINIDWLYQGKEEYVYIVCRSILIKCISLVAMLIFVKSKTDYLTYAWITSFATGGNYCLNLWHARKYVHLDFKNVDIRRHVQPVIIMAAGGMLSSLYGKLDVTMLGILKDETSVGHYTYAFKTEELVLSLCMAATAVLLPRLSYLYEKEDKIQLGKVLDKGIRSLLFLVIPAVAGIELLAPKLIILLYGEDFKNATTILRILILLLPIKGFGDLLGFQMMICIGEDKKRIKANALSCLVNIILNGVLIIPLGSVGAAIASVASELACNSYQITIVRNEVQLPFPRVAFKQAMISTAAMSVVVLLALQINCSLFISCAICVFAGVVTYFAVNLFMKNDFLMSIISKFGEERLQ